MFKRLSFFVFGVLAFVFALATTAYIVLAIQFEERDLVTEHGAAYEHYRRNVAMLLPWRSRFTPTTPHHTHEEVV